MPNNSYEYQNYQLQEPGFTNVSKSEIDYNLYLKKQRPPFIQNLLDEISVGEGATSEKLSRQKGVDSNGVKFDFGTTPYDMVLGYGVYGKPSKPLSEMTFREVHAYQRQLLNGQTGKVKPSKQSTAVGKYQTIGTYLFGAGESADTARDDSWMKKAGLGPDDLYNAENQEKIGRIVLGEAGINDFLRSGDQDRFQEQLSAKWASVAHPFKKGGSYNQRVATYRKDLQSHFDSLDTTIPQGDKETYSLSSVPRPRGRDDPRFPRGPVPALMDIKPGQGYGVEAFGPGNLFTTGTEQQKTDRAQAALFNNPYEPAPEFVQENVPALPVPTSENSSFVSKEVKAPAINLQEIPKMPLQPAPPQNFGQAFKEARAAHGGDGGLFDYNGASYTTDYATANNGTSNVRRYVDGVSDVPPRTRAELEAIIDGPGNGWIFDTPEVNTAQSELAEINRRIALGGGPTVVSEDGVPVPGTPTTIEVETEVANNNLDTANSSLQEVRDAAQIEILETGIISDETRANLNVLEAKETDARNEKEVNEVLLGNVQITEDKKYRAMYLRHSEDMNNRGLTPLNYESWKQKTDIRSGRIPPPPSGYDEIPPIPETSTLDLNQDDEVINEKVLGSTKANIDLDNEKRAETYALKIQEEDPTVAEKITAGMKKWFGIAPEDITRALGYYLMSRATGASHEGSMQWAGKVALKQAEKRTTLEQKTKAEVTKANAAAKILIAAGYTPSSVASWTATGIAGTLDKPGPSYTESQIKNKYAELLKANKFTPESLKAAFTTVPGDFNPGFLILKGGNGKSNAENTGTMMKDLRTDFTAMATDQFGSDNPKATTFINNMMTSAEAYWVDKDIPLGDDAVRAQLKRVTSLAYQAAIKDARKNNTEVSDIAPYLANMSLTEYAQSGADSMWKLGETSGRVPAQKIAELRESMYSMADGDTAVMKSAFLGAVDAYNNLGPDALAKLKPSKGENKFYVFLRETLTRKQTE